MHRARRCAAVLLAALVALACGAEPAQALVAVYTITLTAAGPTNFLSTDNTSLALAATPSLVLNAQFTTLLGGGTIWINSPPNPVGAGGAVLNLAKITVTCTDTGSSGWLTGGSATLVPGGASAPCATIAPNVVLGNTNVKIVLTMDVRTAVADVWTIPGFSVGAMAS